MTRLVLACALIAGCGGGSKVPPPKPPTPLPPVAAVAAVPQLAVSDAGLAGLDGKSRVTLVELRKELVAAGYSVKPDNNGMSLVFDVYRTAGAADDPLFYVVPNEDGSLFNIHVTSTKIGSPQGWHVGGSLSDLSNMSCECWGSQGDEVATCFHPGEHVAVVYERACSGMALNDERNRKVLQGATISRLVWQPKPWVAEPTPAAAPAKDD